MRREPDSIRSAMPQPCMGPRRRVFRTSMSRVPCRRFWSAMAPSLRASKGRWRRAGGNSREAGRRSAQGTPGSSNAARAAGGDRGVEVRDPAVLRGGSGLVNQDGVAGEMGLVIEDVGIEIDAVGPDNRTGLGVDTNLSEVVGVLEGSEHAPMTPHGGPKINNSLRTVRKRQAHNEMGADFDTGNSRVIRQHCSLQRRNRQCRQLGAKPLPVLDELRLMDSSPFHCQGQDSWRKISAQKPDWMDNHPRSIPGIERMEVRRAVVVEVHPDDDAEKREISGMPQRGQRLPGQVTMFALTCPGKCGTPTTSEPARKDSALWGEPYGAGGERHGEDGADQGLLAAVAVADPAEEGAAHRAHHEAGGEGAEGGEGGCGGGVGREEVGTDLGSEEAEEGEVVPLEHVAAPGTPLRAYRPPP